ncbi:MAG: hypothetical protein WCR67_06945 [Bacilli bacterium]
MYKNDFDSLLKIYSPETPEYIQEFSSVPEFERLKDVGMNCGLEYTSFPMFKNIIHYSRHQHSLGVALITYHFTKKIEDTISSLYHDIATPCFAHVIDFLKGDYQSQQATEENTSAIISNSQRITELRKKYQLKVSDIDDCHQYPIADNEKPRLSADRLEYNLGNALQFGFAGLKEIKDIYDNLTITINEEGQPELSFSDLETAEQFFVLSMKNSKVYVADIDRYSMERLARLLKQFIQDGVLSQNDLNLTEQAVITKIRLNEKAYKMWLSFRNISAISVSPYPIENGLKISSKKRYVDPLIKNQGRLSVLSSSVKKEIDNFLANDFNYYILETQN